MFAVGCIGGRCGVSESLQTHFHDQRHRLLHGGSLDYNCHYLYLKCNLEGMLKVFSSAEN